MEYVREMAEKKAIKNKEKQDAAEKAKKEEREKEAAEREQKQKEFMNKLKKEKEERLAILKKYPKPPRYTLKQAPYQKELISLFGIVPVKKIMNNALRIQAQEQSSSSSTSSTKKGGKRKTKRRKLRR